MGGGNDDGTPEWLQSTTTTTTTAAAASTKSTSWWKDDATPASTPASTPSSSPTRASTTTTTTTNAQSNNNTSTSQQQQQQQGNNNSAAAAAAASNNSSSPSAKSFWNCRDFLKRDGRLLGITILIIIVMNIPVIRWIAYPFTIFSTYVHEVCHGLAAVLVGGRIDKIYIFPDGSGLAYTSLPGSGRGRGFVASAGYQGTAVVGCLLLLFRRTKRGPRTGTMTLACFMLLSVILWIRNAFGIVIILFMGLAFGIAAWRLPSFWIRNVYTCLAVTTCLNAITSVHDLYGNNFTVNGEEGSPTDAHTMAEVVGGSRFLWATLWFLMALVFAAAGLIFAIPGPDEPVPFECCGVCRDCGLFDPCNFTRSNSSAESSSNTDTTTPNPNNNNNNTANQGNAAAAATAAAVDVDVEASLPAASDPNRV